MYSCCPSRFDYVKFEDGCDTENISQNLDGKLILPLNQNTVHTPNLEDTKRNENKEGWGVLSSSRYEAVIKTKATKGDHKMIF